MAHQHLAVGPLAFPSVLIFYIYFIAILQKYMVRQKCCKNIHLAPWPTASGTKRRGPGR
jgi:hypothetical protein